jgi:hypothetical protein
VSIPVRSANHSTPLAGFGVAAEITKEASSLSRIEQPSEGRQRKVEIQTRRLWIAAAIACIPVAIAWLQSTEFSADRLRSLTAVLGFILGTIAGLALTLVGSLASISAWRLTARIADQQDEAMANVHGDVNKQGSALLVNLDAAVEKLERNLKVQTEEIQRGRETIRTERRVRSFFRIRALPNSEVSEVDMFRLEEQLSGHLVSFTPVTEDYCVGVLERYLNYCRQSADIQFHVRKRAYSRNLPSSEPLDFVERGASVRENGIAIYFDLTECYNMEGLTLGGLPVRVQREKDQPAALICEGFRGVREEMIIDEPPSYKAVIARFRRYGRQVFVVAGLSQPGTLAAGEFLERLFKEESESATDILHINSRIYEVLSGIDQDQDPDGCPAEHDVCCVVRATVRSEPDDYAVMGLQVDALYYMDDGAKWRREL